MTEQKWLYANFAIHVGSSSITQLSVKIKKIIEWLLRVLYYYSSRYLWNRRKMFKILILLHVNTFTCMLTNECISSTRLIYVRITITAAKCTYLYIMYIVILYIRPLNTLISRGNTYRYISRGLIVIWRVFYIIFNFIVIGENNARRTPR